MGPGRVDTGGGLAGAQDLPDSILAEQYLREATRAFEHGDLHSARRALEKIEALDIEPPSGYLFLKGRVLVEHSTDRDELLEGQSLVKQFFLNTDRNSEFYSLTLGLLSLVEAKVETIEAKRQAETERRGTEARADIDRLREEAERLRGEAGRERQARLKKLLQNQLVHVQGGTF